MVELIFCRPGQRQLAAIRPCQIRLKLYSIPTLQIPIWNGILRRPSRRHRAAHSGKQDLQPAIQSVRIISFNRMSGADHVALRI